MQKELTEKFYKSLTDIISADYYKIYDLLQNIGQNRIKFIDIVKQNGFIDEAKKLKYISTFIDFKEKQGLRYENINKVLKLYIKKIFSNNQLLVKYKFKLGGGTCLALNGDINRYSEDIDLFVNEKQLNNFKQDLQEFLHLNFKKNDANGGYFTYINEDFKIEIIPTDKLNSIKKDGILFTPLIETIENKLNALKERDEFRDIYDLAVLSFENRNILKRITPIHIKKLRTVEGIIRKNRKLLNVLKNEKLDMEIIEAFYKKINI